MNYQSGPRNWAKAAVLAAGGGRSRMIRLALFVLFGAAILAALAGVSIWVFLIPIAALAVIAYTAGGLRLRCPACRKRVKLGATACHHCGRDVRRVGRGEA